MHCKQFTTDALPPAELDRIIEGCREEDAKAQKSLYKLFYAYGLSICLHYGANREEAEEMLHNGFIQVFEKIGQWRGEGAFKAWFRTVIVRQAINYYNRVQKKKRRLGLFRQQLQPKSTANLAIRQLQEEDVYLLLQHLTPVYRMVLSLHVIEGYTHPEIAALLNISVGTSKSNLHKAKAKLAQMIKTYYPQEYAHFND